jgi:E3 ubiquitin-protein ligase DOA10
MTIQSYKCQAKFFLVDTFNWVSCSAITYIFQHVEFGFSDAYAILSELMVVAKDEAAGKALFPRLKPKVKIFLKYRRFKKRFRVNDERLLEEIAQMEALQVKEDGDGAVQGLAENEEDGDADTDAEEPSNGNNAHEFECLCCYGNYPAKVLKGVCDANSLHSVCKGCTNSFVREQVNVNNRVDFTCIADLECKGIYPPAMLDQILTPDTKKRTNDAVFRHDVRQSGMEVWYVRRGQLET